LYKTGDCGCSGSPHDQNGGRAVAQYILRNALMFGLTIVACLLTPARWHTTLENQPLLVILISVLPVLTFCWIAVQRRRQFATARDRQLAKLNSSTENGEQKSKSRFFAV